MGINIAVIGGTGIYNLPDVTEVEKQVIKTPYGSAIVNIGTLTGKRVAFLTRHGETHGIAPGQINFRANIWALKTLGVKNIIATACSGSLNSSYPPGTLVLLDQFIEFTKGRPDSFYGGSDRHSEKIAHVDMTHPYCNRLKQVVKSAGMSMGIDVLDGATYACMEGPRFETESEIRMLRILGADLVAHTQYPEVALAREAEICYCAIGVIANMAAGICDEHVSATDMKTAMGKIFDNVQNVIAKTIQLLSDEDCWCQHALSDSYL